MRALWRHSLAPLVVAAAVFSAVAPASFAAATVHPTVKIVRAACPAGTNWDNVTHTCV
jgi:hypothetical protein